MTRQKGLFFVVVFVLLWLLLAVLERPLWVAVPLASLFTYGSHKLMQKDPHVRGQRKIPYQQAYAIAEQKRKNQRSFIFGGVPVPINAAVTGFLYLGLPGSGKTTSIKHLMQQAFGRIGEGEWTRGVVYDYKMEFYSFLRACGVPKDKIWIFHPRDRRTKAWDLQADLQTPQDAEDIAMGFVPVNLKDKHPHFANSARKLVTAALKFFFFKGQDDPSLRWDLHDLVLLLDDPKTMKFAFQQYIDTRGAIKHLQNEDVLSTLENYTDSLKPVAAFWRDKEKVSLVKWAESQDGQIILLGNDLKAELTSKTMIAALFTRLGKAVGAGPKYELERLTWWFLDEMPQGSFPSLPTFLPTLRAYGSCFVLGIQSLPQMLVAYEDAMAKMIFELMNSKAIFHSTEETAAYAAQKIIGSYELKEENKSTTVSGMNYAFTQGEMVRERLAVHEQELKQLHLATEGLGFVEAFFTTPYVNNYVWHHKLTFAELQGALVPLTAPEDRLDSDPEPVKNWRAFALEDWSEEKRNALGLPVQEEEAEAEEDTERAKRKTSKRKTPQHDDFEM